MDGRRYVFEMSSDSDAWGWRPTWFANAKAGGPAFVMHDVMMHVEPPDGTLEAELQAFGADLYIRGEGRMAERLIGCSWAEIVGPELSVLYRDALDPEQPKAKWPQVAPPHGKRLLASDYAERQLRAAFDLASDWLADEPDVDALDVRRHYRGGLAGPAVGWLRCGYLAARRFYSPHAPTVIADLAEGLANTAAEHLQAYAGKPARLVVRFHPKVPGFSTYIHPDISSGEL